MPVATPLHVHDSYAILGEERSIEVVRDADPSVPFTILAFFPEHKLRDARPPSLWEMLGTYASVRHVGLENVKIGNCGVFVQTPGDQDILLSVVGEKALG